jgi:hypothetical protein
MELRALTKEFSIGSFSGLGPFLSDNPGQACKRLGTAAPTRTLRRIEDCLPHAWLARREAEPDSPLLLLLLLLVKPCPCPQLWR